VKLLYDYLNESDYNIHQSYRQTERRSQLWQHTIAIP